MRTASRITVPGWETTLTRDAGAPSQFALRRVMSLLRLAPLAISPGTAGHRLADLVLGRVSAPTDGYVNRDRVAPSLKGSYNPERELWDALESLSAESPSEASVSRMPAGLRSRAS